MKLSTISAAVILFLSSMPALAFDPEAENDRFLADLNTYTNDSSLLVFYGKQAFPHPEKTGPVVTFRGRGPQVHVAGVDEYKGVFVQVGYPCEGCVLRLTRYHTERAAGELDDVIAVYQRE